MIIRAFDQNDRVVGSMTIDCGRLSKANLIAFAYRSLKLCCQKRPVAVKPLPSGLSPLNKPGITVPTYPSFVIVSRDKNVAKGGPASVSKPVDVLYNVLGSSWGTPGSGVAAKGLKPFVSDVGAKRYSWTDSRTGSKLPNWRSIVRTGGNATTAMQAQRARVEHSGGVSVQLTIVDDAQTTYRQLGYSGYVSTQDPVFNGGAGMVSVVDNKSLAKLREKLYALEHDADIGETLAEYKQLLSMVGNPLQGIRDLIDIYHRRAAEVIANRSRRVGKPSSRFNPRDVKDVNAALASLWLEFNFGLKPLYYEVLAIIKSLEDSRKSCKTKISSSFRDDALVSDTTTISVLNNYLTFNVRSIVRSRLTVRYQVGIRPEKVEALSFAKRIGLTPERFVPTLYAIFPYSWANDYFTGINTTIDSLCDDFRFTTWVAKTVRDETIAQKVSVLDSAATLARVAPRGVACSGGACTVTASTVTVNRSVPANLVAAPYLTIPKSWRPYANLSALAFQRKLAGLAALGGPGLQEALRNSNFNPFTLSRN